MYLMEHRDLDVALLSTPLNLSFLKEKTLFYEPFIVYTSSNDTILNKKFILAKDIDIHRLCLLEEGHYLRLQAINLCELRNKEKDIRQTEFETGNIETLKRIVEENNGITILPLLTLKGMSPDQKNNARFFKKPVPVREIGLVTYRYFVKENLILKLKEEIVSSIPVDMISSA